MDSARPTPNARILIVEDEALIAADLGDALQHQGFEIVGMVATAERALQTIEQGVPDLALLDIHLRGRGDGIDVGRKLRELRVPFVFLTANSDPATLGRAEAVEPSGYLVKPFDERTLYATVRMALFRAEADRERESRRAMLVSAVDRIDRPVLGLTSQARIRWANAPASQAGVTDGMELHRALKQIGRPELEPGVRAALAGEAEAPEGGGSFRLVAAERGHVLIIGEAPDAPLCLCAWCQKARNDEAEWEPIESVLRQRYGLGVTHGICNACVDTHFTDFGVDP